MKLKFLLISFGLIFVNMILPNDAFSQKKYYIIFDNFEDQKTVMSVSGGPEAGTTITNLFDLCYWEILRDDVILGKYAERKPFNAATFLAKDITEYDVAVFVMGTSLGLSTTVDGIKVLDKIKQMLAANKSVVIIGHAILPIAFGMGDTESKEWLQSYLGIQEAGVLKLLNGSAIEGFRVDGIEGDPVSAGFRKQCNRIYNENNSGDQAPIRWYPEAFFVSNLSGGKNAVAFDYIKEIWGTDVKPEDKFITGVRSEVGKARCMFYSLNFDIVSGAHLIHFRNSLVRGMRWAVRDLPHPEGFLAVEDETLDFGIIEPKQKGYLVASIQNNGRDKVKISGFKIAGDEPEGSFYITDGNQAVELGPGDIHQLNIVFAPTEERNYEDYLTIESNAINGNIEITLKGTGGEQVFNGPKLSLTEIPIDFGTVPYGLFSEKNIPITNAGNVSLVVEKVKLTDDGEKHFSFAEIVKTPITIPPGKSVNVKVRYTSSDEEYANFTGRLDVESNGLGSNQGRGFVVLKGGSQGKNANSGVSLSSTSIDFGQVEIDKPTMQILKITNIGSTNLKLFKIQWDKSYGGENLDQFAFLDGTDKNLPTLSPGESHELKIQFSPKKAKDYASKIQMLTNNPVNDGIIEVPLSGSGYDPSSVKYGIAYMNGLTVSVNPNPVKDISKIELKLEKSGNIKMDLIDLTGRKITNLMNNYLNSGVTYSDFDAQKYINGMYFILVDFNGEQVQLPFIITK